MGSGRAVRGKVTNYYRRFPGDYLADTGSLNLLQHGAYTLLLDHLYATERRIATEQDAFRICRAATEEERWAVTEILRNFFKKTTAGFTNNRYEKEKKTRAEWCKRQKTKRDRSRDNHRDSHRDSHGQFTVSPSPLPLPLKEREEKERSAPPPPKLTDTQTFARKSFERFWVSYPKQIDRDVCFRLWLALGSIDQDKAAESVAGWLKSESWSDTKYIPNPETFIVRRRWESTPTVPVNLASRKNELEAKFEPARR